MAVIKHLLAALNAISVLVIFLVTAIFIPTFSMEFYRAEYTKLGIPNRVGVEEEQLMAVTKHLTDYMRGREDDLVITAEVNGVSREFFGERDKAHMVDVRNLFTLARVCLVIAICTLAITSFILRGSLKQLARAALVFTLGFIGLLAVLTAIIAMDFERAFTIFHLIFFNNDLWMLDPATSLLLNIVPLEFFMDIAARVALIFCGLTLAYMCVSFLYLRKRRR